MTGSRTSVLGVKPEQALRALITQMPVRFETADEDVWVMGAVVEVNDEGLAESIEQVMVPGLPSGLLGRAPARVPQPSDQRHQQQRVEPDDVEVEPVLQRSAAAPISSAAPSAATWVRLLAPGPEG